MIDTHCHLNFSRFKGKVPAVLERARKAGIRSFIVPGTDVTTSCAAISLAEQEPDVYAAVGIHPHHAFEQGFGERMEQGLTEIRSLLQNRNVVAIGEVGLDRFEYKHTKYKGYAIDHGFITLQKELLRSQLEIARDCSKAVILHNREAVEETLELLHANRETVHGLRMVFHCCEPDKRLLQYAVKHGIFIGVDGDVTYNQDKASFAREIPLDLLVLETDSPYLLPEPLRSEKKFPNEPSSIAVISEYIAKIRNTDVKTIRERTTHNAMKLFSLPEKK